MDSCTIRRDFLTLEPAVLQTALKRGRVLVDEQKNLLQRAIEIEAGVYVLILLIGGALADALSEEEKTRNFFGAVFGRDITILANLDAFNYIPEGAVPRGYAAALLLKNPDVVNLLQPKVEGLLAASIEGNPIAYMEKLSEECRGTFFQLACKIEHVAFVRIIAPLVPPVIVEKKYVLLVLTDSPVKRVLQEIIGFERSAAIEGCARAFREAKEKAREEDGKALALPGPIHSRLPCEGKPSDAREIYEEVASGGRAPPPLHLIGAVLAPGGSSPKKPPWFIRVDRWLGRVYAHIVE
jgi:hypothetical protein